MITMRDSPGLLGGNSRVREDLLGMVAAVVPTHTECVVGAHVTQGLGSLGGGLVCLADDEDVVALAERVTEDASGSIVCTCKCK